MLFINVVQTRRTPKPQLLIFRKATYSRTLAQSVVLLQFFVTLALTHPLRQDSVFVPIPFILSLETKKTHLNDLQSTINALEALALFLEKRHIPRDRRFQNVTEWCIKGDHARLVPF